MLIAGFFEGLTPIRSLTVSEWADEFRYLDSQSSAEAGLWRTDRTPYLRAIMDDLSDSSEVQVVVFMKGAQIGGSECGFNWIAYTIDISPAPMLMVMPTDATVKTNSNIRITPMIEACPSIREKIGEKRSKDSNNTINVKAFPGGFLKMVGANSAAGLRSMPIRKLFLDEVDEYPSNLDEQGSPIDLAKARTKTFGSNKKIFIVSTPTVAGASVIEMEYEKTDQRKFFVPCPHCEHKQILVFENLKWTKGQPETARFECVNCKELIEERHKPYMLENGEWQATAPQKASRILVGYHINSFYSPYGWYSWQEAAAAWEDALGDEQKETTYINTVLGETVEVKADVPEWEHLFNRCGTFAHNSVLESVLFITVGVDVQKDRLELEIVGWCANMESYSIDYRVIMGDTTSTEVWDKLAAVVTETWEMPDETEMPMALMAIDSGYNTQHVYDFCRRFDVSRVIPVKGSQQFNPKTMVSAPSPVDYTRDGQRIGTIKIWTVGGSLIKSELYAFLRKNINEQGEIPRGYCHFPQYAPHFFKGLTAERIETREEKGYSVHYWVKHFVRNEPLDCRVYARAAASVLGYDRLTPEQLNRRSKAIARNKAVDKKNNSGAVESKKERKKRSGGSFW